MDIAELYTTMHVDCGSIRPTRTNYLFDDKEPINIPSINLGRIEVTYSIHDSPNKQGSTYTKKPRPTHD